MFCRDGRIERNFIRILLTLSEIFVVSFEIAIYSLKQCQARGFCISSILLSALIDNHIFDTKRPLRMFTCIGLVV